MSRGGESEGGGREEGEGGLPMASDNWQLPVLQPGAGAEEVDVRLPPLPAGKCFADEYQAGCPAPTLATFFPPFLSIPSGGMNGQQQGLAWAVQAPVAFPPAQPLARPIAQNHEEHFFTHDSL